MYHVHKIIISATIIIDHKRWPKQQKQEEKRADGADIVVHYGKFAERELAASQITIFA